jgi:hypothetical protein
MWQPCTKSLHTIWENLTFRLGLWVCGCVCMGLCVHACEHAHSCLCRRGKIICFITLQLIPLRQGLSLKLELTISDEPGWPISPGILYLPLLPTLSTQFQVCIAIPGSLHGFWVFDIMVSLIWSDVKSGELGNCYSKSYAVKFIVPMLHKLAENLGFTCVIYCIYFLISSTCMECLKITFPFKNYFYSSYQKVWDFYALDGPIAVTILTSHMYILCKEIAIKRHPNVRTTPPSLYPFHKLLPILCYMSANWKLNRKPNANLQMFWRMMPLYSLPADDNRVYWVKNIAINSSRESLVQNLVPKLNKRCGIRWFNSISLYFMNWLVVRIYGSRTPTWKEKVNREKDVDFTWWTEI